MFYLKDNVEKLEVIAFYKMFFEHEILSFL